MVVWDPVSGSRTELHNIVVPDIDRPNYSATVLCAANGCNHTACNLGPFFVVVAFIGIDKRLVLASVYSSETWECRQLFISSAATIILVVTGLY
ncbi:hypothetical protein ZWY2020_050295 [Hordeum vulgare]|nr:hypothetical protein ZWY2020_050295 [Hordeum vulgare]